MKKYKRIILLFLCILFIFSKEEVKASEESFYGAEWLNIYYTKESGTKKQTNKVRVIRNDKTNQLAYCLEPFSFLENDEIYEEEYKTYDKELNLTEEQYKRIMLLSYYGYQYKEHTEKKWYSITQILIWRTIDKNGSYYWVNSDGNKLNIYQNEIKELEKLVKEHEKRPSFTEEKKVFSINRMYSISDLNYVLENYSIKESNINAKITKNAISLYTNEEQTGKIIFEKKDRTYQMPMIIYYDKDSQDVAQLGSYTPFTIEWIFEVKSGSITVKKIDSETKDSIAQGDASLEGTIYYLYDRDKVFLKELIIGSNGTTTINNLKFNKYYLKEIKSGKGYIIDQTMHEININEKNINVEMILENDVIKGNVKIKKYYGNEQNIQLEPNVNFNIYDSNNNLIKTVITDINGEINLNLPYGTYTFTQISGKENYEKVDDFIITIESNEEIKKELYDMEIETPNTNTRNNKIIFLMITLISSIVYVKIKI